MKALQSKSLAIITFLMICFVSYSQEQKLCGTTIDLRTEQLIADGLIPITRLRTSAEDPYKLAISAHIIRRDDGTGGLSESQLESALDKVNNFYKAAGLEFFIFGDIHFVDSDKFFDYDASDESSLAGSRDIANTINIYFANSVTSQSSALCGYAYFPGNPDRILMDNSCTINGTTLSHEIGHYLTLYHTHGKTNNGTTDELVDGSNCITAGDEICDTPADPNLTGKVNGSCQYTSSQRDANGDLFQPNTENVMSYSPQNCRRLFSSGQFERALSGYLSFRDYLIQKQYQADFTPSQSIVCVGQEITLNNLSLGEFDNLEWQFPNGSPVSSTEINPKIIYAIPGSYDVQLTIYGSDGGTDVKIIENAIKVVEYESITETGINLNFESNTIEDFNIHSPSDEVSFTIESTGKSSDQSLSLQFFNSPIQSIDYFLFNPIENPDQKDYVISFDYAFTYFTDGSSERIDEINILSKSCDEWNVIWEASGKTNRTSDPKASPYTPEDSDWVHLEKYVPVDENSDFVQVAIKTKSNSGNNFYIDNIAIAYATEIVVRDITVTPEQCAGDSDGIIEVQASFNGNEISYSLDDSSYQSNGLFQDLTAGTYNVFIKSGEEVISLDIVLSSVTQKPAKPIIVFSNNELRLLASAFEIEWYYNGELIDDSGKTKIPFRGIGNYHVIVRNEIGCESRSDIFTVLSSGNEFYDLEVYPNPSNSFLNVKASEPTTLQIVDLTGTVLMELPSFENEITIDLRTLKSGVYILRGSTKKAEETRLVIVNR